MRNKYEVGYGTLDAFKRAAQAAASRTGANIERLDARVVEWSRGESVFLVEYPDHYAGHVNEGLGTKNIVGDHYALDLALAEDTDWRHDGCSYDNLAQCTAAMILNDMATLGVVPVSLHMHLAVENASWFERAARAEALVGGWEAACREVRCAWGGGETPALRDLVLPGRSILSGSADGIVTPKGKLIRRNIADGDVIVLLESSGIHANGLTFARDLAKEMRKGYLAPLSNGEYYGKALLTPTHLYGPFIEDCINAHIEIHYGVNITGHGWRKLMRAPEPFSYEIGVIPDPMPLFEFIEQKGGVSRRNMFADFNMGAGFALYMPEEDARAALQLLAKGRYPFGGFIAGEIKAAQERRVIIRPLGIEFTASELEVR